MKICGIEYDIKFTEKGSLELDGNKLFGQMDMGEQTIQIGDYGQDRGLETARHEIAHVYIEEYLLGWDEFTAEDVCMLIGKYGQEICDKANKIMKVK